MTPFVLPLASEDNEPETLEQLGQRIQDTIVLVESDGFEPDPWFDAKHILQAEYLLCVQAQQLTRIADSLQGFNFDRLNARVEALEQVMIR